MPTLKKKRRAYLPEPRTPFEGAERSDHLRTARWTKASKRYRMQHPLCEVSKYYGLTVGAEQVDHIIRVQDGGSIYDKRNLMSITKELHDFKTGKEQHSAVMVETMENEHGDLIPRDRNEIMKLFVGKFNRTA